MKRRTLITAFAALLPALASETVRGKLIQAGGRPALEVAGGKLIYLQGDDQTSGVVNDPRLSGMDFLATGRFIAPDTFAVDPIHTKAMFVLKDGRKLFITYWCDVCAIRTYSPGKCWCCQEETELDLRERYDP